MAGTANVLSSIVAHSAGHVCLVSVSPKEVISGGADGELAIHKVIQNDKLETITHKRVHKGIVNAISIIDSSHYASVGEDGTTYVTTRLGEVLTSRLVYRSTLPLKSLACNDSEIVITGDEFKVIIIAITDGSTKWTSEIMDSPIVGLGWIDNGNDQLISASTKGRITIWNRHEGDYKAIVTFDLKVQLAKFTKVFNHDQHIYLCCPDSKSQMEIILLRNRWSLHIEPE